MQTLVKRLTTAPVKAFPDSPVLGEPGRRLVMLGWASEPPPPALWIGLVVINGSSWCCPPHHHHSLALDLSAAISG